MLVVCIRFDEIFGLEFTKKFKFFEEGFIVLAGNMLEYQKLQTSALLSDQFSLELVDHRFSATLLSLGCRSMKRNHRWLFEDVS